MKSENRSVVTVRRSFPTSTSIYSVLESSRGSSGGSNLPDTIGPVLDFHLVTPGKTYATAAGATAGPAANSKIPALEVGLREHRSQVPAKIPLMDMWSQCTE
jgi:hypothetical protein